MPQSFRAGILLSIPCRRILFALLVVSLISPCTTAGLARAGINTDPQASSPSYLESEQSAISPFSYPYLTRGQCDAGEECGKVKAQSRRQILMEADNMANESSFWLKMRKAPPQAELRFMPHSEKWTARMSRVTRDMGERGELGEKFRHEGRRYEMM